MQMRRLLSNIVGKHSPGGFTGLPLVAGDALASSNAQKLRNISRQLPFESLLLL